MFQKLVSFTKKVADLPDKPSLNPTELKAQFDSAPDEVRVYFNNLIDALKSTATGDSGAKNIGATGISGLTGTDVQTLLESLKTNADKKVTATSNGVRIESHPAIFFTNGGSNSATATITFATPFTTAPIVMPANMTQAQAYGDVILYPYIYNVTTTGCSVKITGDGGANLGTAGSPGNIFLNFVVFGQ